MNRRKKIATYIQIVVMTCLTLCSAGVVINLPKKPVAFPCKDHDCGCASAADCMTDCCCFPETSRLKSNNGEKGQKNSFHSFISSIKCKSGSDVITFINTQLKYLTEDPPAHFQILFLCFLTNDTDVRLREPVISPPEKPPRYLT